MQSDLITHKIRSKAIEMGFLNVSFTKAEHMDAEAKRLEQWLKQGLHGDMQYMENHFDKRVDPSKLVPGATSVITLSYNYYSSAKQKVEKAPRIASYAFGKDYHNIVKQKLTQLLIWMKSEFGDFIARSFVDSAPILERDLALRSGHGWVGKNTLLIHPKRGSFFFLCEIICDLPVVFDSPIKNYCGTCRKCIEACPTEAISAEGYLLDSNRCISYLTIEYKEALPQNFNGKMGGWAFGCDICQDVCPWNRFSIPHSDPNLQPLPGLMDLTMDEWLAMSEDTFRTMFKDSPIKRTKYTGLMRNIHFLSKNSDSCQEEN
ncbi:MAG: tRNA epoxyqueuosine(34) reductase QueG [Saprospiraceae bacterium]